jgi:hypothetical protein
MTVRNLGIKKKTVSNKKKKFKRDNLNPLTEIAKDEN